MKNLFIALICIASFTTANAATLKPGTCRGISTQNGFKYVGDYCEDFQCTVVSRYIFDSWCPYTI